MGKVRISALPDGGKLQNNEVLVGNRNGITYKFSAWLMPGLNTPYIITAAYADTTIDQNILLLQGGTAQQITLPEPSMFPPQFMNNTAIKVYNQGSNAALLFAQSPTFQWQEYSIVSNIDNPPTYALNSTHIPTLTNASIVANKVVASANSASATTWNYSTGAVTQIIPYVVFTPTALDIDLSSTTGSIKVNYATNNLLQVGSKVLVTDGGVTTEQTIEAGSQASGTAPFSGTWGTISFGSANGKLFAYGSTNKTLRVSSDNGVTWSSAGTIPTGATRPAIINNIVFFNDKYYLGLMYDGTRFDNNNTLWVSSDLNTWTVAIELPGLGSNAETGSVACAVINDILVAIGGTGASFSGENVTNGTMQPYYSSDGQNFTASPNSYAITNMGRGCPVFSIYNVQNRVCISWVNKNPIYTTDGINYIQLSNLSSLFNLYPVSLMWSGTNFICVVAGNQSGIYTSGDGISWTQVIGMSGLLPLLYNGTVYISASGTTVQTSTNGTTWSSSTKTGSSIGTPNICVHNGVFYAGLTYFSSDKTMMTSNASASSWSEVDLGTASGGYQFTITSPSLPVPEAMYLGGQSLSYSVSTTITPSYTNATLNYVDNAGVITATGAQDVATGSNVMLKFEGMNSGESMQEIGAALYIRSQEGITLPQNKVMTLTPYKSQYEVDAYYYLIDIADTP